MTTPGQTNDAREVFQIAGISNVFHAPVDTPAMNLSTYVPGEESYGEWQWFGDTSSESIYEFETDGGETETKRTHSRLNARSTRTPRTVSLTLQSVRFTRETLQLAFPSGTYDAATDSFTVGTGTDSRERALMFVIEDEGYVSGIYVPRADIAGGFPTFSLEEITEIPFTGAVLGSLTQRVNGRPVEWRSLFPREMGTGETGE